MGGAGDGWGKGWVGQGMGQSGVVLSWVYVFSSACLRVVTGSLDRCVSGVAADIILKHSRAPPPASEKTEQTALRVTNLHPLPSDPVIQVSRYL